MPYTTLDQMEDRFGTQMLIDLTDRGEVATGTIDMDVMNKALTSTDAIIDGYLKVRYALPLSEEQPLVKELAEAIAIYKLHVYQPDEKIAQDYRDAIASLRLIGEGAIQLSAAGVAPADSGTGGARVTDRERPFTEGNMKGFI